MDWQLAISRNRQALQEIVAALFALAAAAAAAIASPGLSRRRLGESGKGEAILPSHVHAAILMILRPAESAVRRLITIAALGLVLKPCAARPLPIGLPAFPSGGSLPTPAFYLFDPLKRFTLDDFDNNALPHNSFSSICGEGSSAPVLLSDAPVNADRMFTRLRALRHALNDLPRQARRLVRWQARRDQALAASRPTRITPMRPGLPPGWRQRSIHEVDDVLRECHGLALHAVNGPDSS